MVYWISEWAMAALEGTAWEETFSFLRLFQYITIRSAGAGLTALALGLCLGPWVIRTLQRVKFGQQFLDKAEEMGLENRIDKRGTPTMGGILIIPILDISALIWAQWNELVLITLISMIVLAGLGFYDDFVKITKTGNKGVSSSVKWITQIILAGAVVTYFAITPEFRTIISEVRIPYWKDPILSGVMWIGGPIVFFTLIGSSNAVNLTDGLDGLAIGCTMIVAIVLAIWTYAAGHIKFAAYLNLQYVPGAGELTVFCSAILGAGLAFLWFNAHPAELFMGDTGSLALGGALGVMAILVHQPFVLFIAGGVFVMEAASVMIQTSYFKFTRIRTGEGKRFFKMAPIHHHFEKMGWYETKVVFRLYILGIIFAVIALSALKIR